MKDFSDILICSDFDNTLFRNIVSDKDAEAIRYFQEHGGAFTLCTGRCPTVLIDKNITNITLNAPIICMNGALIYDLENKKKLFEDVMNADIIETILKICEHPEDIVNLFLPTQHDLSTTDDLLPHETDKIISFVQKGAYKVVFRVNKDRCDEILARVCALTPKEFGVSRSWSTGIEIQNATNNKGLSARKVANMLGRKTLICVGDYENDITMIEEADIGYAVANACELLKKAADKITENSVGGAIAEIIYSL